MKKLFGTMVVIILAMLAAHPGRADAQASDPASVIAAFVAAAPGSDTQVQLLAPNVTFRVDPPPPGSTGVWTGKEQVLPFLKRNQAENVRRELVGTWQVDGNTVRGTILVSNTNFDVWGVGKVEHTLEAVVEHGKLTSFSASMSPSERPRVTKGREAAQTPQVMPATGGTDVLDNRWLVALVGAMLISGLGLVMRRRLRHR